VPSSCSYGIAVQYPEQKPKLNLAWPAWTHVWRRVCVCCAAVWSVSWIFQMSLQHQWQQKANALSRFPCCHFTDMLLLLTVCECCPVSTSRRVWLNIFIGLCSLHLSCVCAVFASVPGFRQLKVTRGRNTTSFVEYDTVENAARAHDTKQVSCWEEWAAQKERKRLLDCVCMHVRV
jgi:hypothetical protein